MQRVALHEEDRIWVAFIHQPGPGRGAAETLQPIRIAGGAGKWQICVVTCGPDFQTWFAHEVGHALGLLHAPGAPDNVRGYWPEDPKYDGGLIGVPGYDLTTGTLKIPATQYDIMSYTAPNWISDFSYRRVMDYLLAP